MIYLIGGAPRVGKSIAARRLMKKLGVSWVSTDILNDVIVKVTPEELRDKLFPFANTVKGWTENDIKKIVTAQFSQIKSLKEGVSVFIRHQIHFGEDFIVEGVHILPSEVARMLKSKRYKDHVRCVFVVPSSVSQVLRGMKAKSSHYDWTSGVSDEVKERIAKVSYAFGTKIASQARKFKLPVIVRTNDFAGDTQKVIKKLSK